MSYKEEFKIYCSTIAGEAGASSDEAIKTVARSIITRTGFREWKSYATAFEVIKYSGYDAYTDRSSSPNYKVVYKAMSSGRLDDLSRKIIKLIEPIYKQEIPDETGMVSLYYSPKAQKALHEKYPKKYKERPPWNFSQLERVYIAGTSKDDFNWYRYKGDGTTVKTSLLNSVNSPVSSKKITIKVTDRLGKYFVKEYTTNNKGEIPDIHARKNSIIEFFVGETSCKTNIIADGKPKKVTLKDYECKFNTTTIPHTTIAPTSPATNSSQSENSQGTKDDEQTAKTNNSLDEVTFEIKLVEGDTGKPLPNTTYHLEYKNNIKPHKTDSSGVESGIKADVSQSISVYLDDDDGKKQSIYSMSFPVTGDLNGQTKVLKVPVVTIQLIFIDKNKKPVPNYEFKTVYRGRTSEIRKANARGIAVVKALAGQQLKIIHVAANKFTRNIVTDGATEWTYSTDKLNEDPNSSTSSTSNVPSSTPSSSQKPNDTKPNNTSATDKGTVIRNDKVTQQGPTHQVKTDQAKITIKFVDDATNKPLSGLTYWTQSTKYGKNASTTRSDGTRGRTHDSDVGISIAVLVNENGKEVKKGTIVANSDKNGVAYVYKAKKPELELSGAHWHSRFMPSTQLSSLKEPFRSKAIAFDKAMKAAGIQVSYTNAYRPPQSQYLMYYSAMIARGQIDPKNVPPFQPENNDEPVNISWIHYNSTGNIDKAVSKSGGTSLFNKYGIGNNPIGKPYKSNHNGGEAFDCRISNWGIGKTITNASGQRITIKSRADIAKVGDSYGVKHWSQYGEKATGKKDDPHWSKSGR